MPRHFTHGEKPEIWLQAPFAFFQWLSKAGPNNSSWIISRSFIQWFPSKQGLTAFSRAHVSLPAEEVILMAGSPPRTPHSKLLHGAFLELNNSHDWVWPHTALGGMTSAHGEEDKHEHNEFTKLPECRKLANYPALIFSRDHTKGSLLMRRSQKRRERQLSGKTKVWWTMSEYLWPSSEKLFLAQLFPALLTECMDYLGKLVKIRRKIFSR